MRKSVLLENLVIESYANEGKCIAHSEGKVVFVKGTMPGEIVNAQIIKSKKDWIEAEAIEIVQPAAERQSPFCPHFGYCGGCQWQHIQYGAQIRYKERAVVETLERLGGIKVESMLPIVGSDADREYRNKLEFTFSHREWIVEKTWNTTAAIDPGPALGYHFPKYFDRVFDVKTCFLQPALSDRIRNAIKDFTKEKGYEYFDLRRHSGLMRNVIIRMTTTGEVMVLVVFAASQPDKILPLMEFLRLQFPEITSLQYTVNQKANDTIYDLNIISYAGSDSITESLGKLKFRISAKSFFQTNTRQAEKLYRCVKDFAEFTGKEMVYDLYTGTGSIALYVAGSCKKVIGIESVAQAIEDAKVNATINEINNVAFQVADMATVFNEQFYRLNGRPDVVITDPPRIGMHPDVVKELLQMAPQKIIYVSCNVATQARDLKMLSEKYIVERIRPFDLFPQTHHVENVASLRLKDAAS